MSKAKTIVIASHAYLYRTRCLRQVIAHSATAYLVRWHVARPITLGYCQWCSVGFWVIIG